ncbi:hypothetical protein V1477_000140 [Vespula maculifrons]|uniref:Uncharacterized protein n=1 Tax=Vespula maculifrons TaxID=7453 RepID=A0ABD2D3K2_VESMC
MEKVLVIGIVQTLFKKRYMENIRSWEELVILVEHFGNSESGYSYAPILLYVHFQPANGTKTGEVYIISTTRSCACVDLNPYLIIHFKLCIRISIENIITSITVIY